MKKVVIIYYSETGNTELMAKAIAEGAESAGGQVRLINGRNATIADVVDADVVALGAPAMGAEQVQVTMEDFTLSIKDSVKDKPLALFGSYDWGYGIWINNWHSQMSGYGADMIQDKDELIVQLAPDEEDIEKCRELGRKLVEY